MFDISERRGAKRCITFLNLKVRREWARLMPAVQGWYFNRLQDVALERGVLGPVPVDLETVCRIYYEPMDLSREEWEDFVEAYADDYPHIVEVLVLTKVEYIAVSSLRF